jgi:monoterpene epsilon-lactone hydrolase
VSLRGELVRLGARWFIKRRTRRETAEQMRQRLRAIERLYPRPPASTTTAAANAGQVKAHRITTPASQPDQHVLYLHGGGYRAGALICYRHLTWRIASATHASVLAIDYRLAPEHPFPAALDDAISAYRWMVAEGADPRRCAVIGDSAGGGLALAMLLRLRDEGFPTPAAATVISPWTDLALTGASLHRNARSDPMLNAGDLPMLVAEYLAGTDPRNPYASPLYGDPVGLPPVLIQVGSDEILHDDAVRMAERLRSAGCRVELEIWPRMPHAWHLFVPVLPEAHRAIRRIGDFVRRRFAA